MKCLNGTRLDWLAALLAAASFAGGAQAEEGPDPGRVAAARAKLEQRLIDAVYGPATIEHDGRVPNSHVLALFALTYAYEDGVPVPLLPNRVGRTAEVLRLSKIEPNHFCYTGSLAAMSIARLLPHMAKRHAENKDVAGDPTAAGGSQGDDPQLAWAKEEGEIISALRKVWELQPSTPPDRPYIATWYNPESTGTRWDPSAMQFVAMAYYLHEELTGEGLTHHAPTGEGTVDFWTTIREAIAADIALGPPPKPLPLGGLEKTVRRYNESFFNLSSATAATYYLACRRAPRAAEGPPDPHVRMRCGTRIGDRERIRGDESTMAVSLGLVDDWLAMALPRVRDRDQGLHMGEGYMRSYGLYALERLATQLGVSSLGDRSFPWYATFAREIAGRVQEEPAPQFKSPGEVAGTHDEALTAAALDYLFLSKSLPARVPWLQVSAHPSGEHFHLTALDEGAAMLRRKDRLDHASWHPVAMQEPDLAARLEKAPIAIISEPVFPASALRTPATAEALRRFLGRGGCLVFENAGADDGEAEAFSRDLGRWLPTLCAAATPLRPASEAELESLGLKGWATQPGRLRVAASHGPRPNIYVFRHPITCRLDSFCDAGWSATRASARADGWQPLSRDEAYGVLKSLLDLRTLGGKLPWIGWQQDREPPAPRQGEALRVGWLSGRCSGDEGSPAGWVYEPVLSYREGEALPAASAILEENLPTPAGQADGPCVARIVPLDQAGDGPDALSRFDLAVFTSIVPVDSPEAPPPARLLKRLRSLAARGGVAYVEIAGAPQATLDAWAATWAEGGEGAVVERPDGGTVLIKLEQEGGSSPEPALLITARPYVLRAVRCPHEAAAEDGATTSPVWESPLRRLLLNETPR